LLESTNAPAAPACRAGYGAPLTVVAVDGGDAGLADLRAYLWSAPGVAGRFSAFAMHPDVEAAGLLTAAQLGDLRDYRRATGARTLKFDAAPASLGLAEAPCADGDGQLRFTTSTPFGISGVRPDASVGARGLRRCPGLETSTTGQCCAQPSGGAAPACSPCRVAPVLRVLQPNGAPFAPQQAPGALAMYDDGRQALAFMLHCSDEYAACLVLAHLGVAWALQNIIPGERRALMSLQARRAGLGRVAGAAPEPAAIEPLWPLPSRAAGRGAAQRAPRRTGATPRGGRGRPLPSSPPAPPPLPTWPPLPSPPRHLSPLLPRRSTTSSWRQPRTTTPPTAPPPRT
jgi:hypothetical protein